MRGLVAGVGFKQVGFITKEINSTLKKRHFHRENI